MLDWISEREVQEDLQSASKRIVKFSHKCSHNETNPASITRKKPFPTWLFRAPLYRALPGSFPHGFVSHSYTRRCHGHDYRAPFIYHIILSKADGCATFGSVKGDARIKPGRPGSAYIEMSPLGNIIKNAIKALPKDFPIVQLYQYCVTFR